jgi:hypothetical protein
MKCCALSIVVWLLLCVPPMAHAEVFEVHARLSDYMDLLGPGERQGRLPLLILMPDASRVDTVVVPFSGEPGDPSLAVERALAIIRGELTPDPADLEVEPGPERYRSAVMTLAGDRQLTFPLVVLVRIDATLLESLDQPSARYSDALESGLRDWVETEPSRRGVLVVSIQSP